MPLRKTVAYTGSDLGYQLCSALSRAGSDTVLLL